ncbi:MAG: uroporphyrinogen decarboxylase family protein [Anaerolineae bacterium]|jgi:uroporphyrinogen decarboxylase
MPEMSGRERIARILKRQPVDRIGLYEHFWGDTRKVWTDQGHLTPDEDLADHFGFDMDLCWCFDVTADLDFQPVVVEETDETVVTRDGNGALLRRHKLHDATPEHLDFDVKGREQWEVLKRKIQPEWRRIDRVKYRQAREHAHERGRFFMWSGVNVFEILKDVTGHVNMLTGMALDPDWVRDMAATYAQLTIDLQEMLFAAEGYPDGIWYYEDMGFKDRPFMSPAMYREIIQPAHTHTIAFAKAHGLPVIMHSCGMVERLLPGMIAAGIDCLQVLEVKAGMDLVKLYGLYGEVLSFMGGIDVRALYTNDRAQVEAELQAKVPPVMPGYGYILHSDHSIPNTVTYDTYHYFVERGLAIGTYA